MCLRSKRTTTFFPLKSTTWLLNSKLMKSPCVPAGIISKCTTVDCEDYAFISGGRDGSLTSEFRRESRALVGVGKDIFSISLREYMYIRRDRSSIPKMGEMGGLFRVERCKNVNFT